MKVSLYSLHCWDSYIHVILIVSVFIHKGVNSWLESIFWLVILFAMLSLSVCALESSLNFWSYSSHDIPGLEIAWNNFEINGHFCSPLHFKWIQKSKKILILQYWPRHSKRKINATIWSTDFVRISFTIPENSSFAILAAPLVPKNQCTLLSQSVMSYCSLKNIWITDFPRISSTIC